MNIAQDINDHIYHIHGFNRDGVELSVPGHARHLNGKFKSSPIDGLVTLHNSFIVTPLLLIEEWDAHQVVDLGQTSVTEPLLSLDIELLLLGSGEKLTFPEAALLAPLMQKGIGIEVMDSRAACRTYNLLSGEGRKVAAAIIL